MSSEAVEEFAGCGDGGFYLTKLPNGWVVGRFRALDQLTGIVHAVTTRTGMDVQQVKNDHIQTAGQLAGALCIDHVAWLEQVHGNDVHVVGAGGFAGQGDGLLTAGRSLGLSVRSADCALILLADPAGRAVGAAHASWRGTVKRVAQELVRKSVAMGVRPEEAVACVCPSAGPCCYEVGQDVVDAAVSGLGAQAKRFLIERQGRTYFDLWSANVDQLLSAGLRRENIHIAGVCTLCRNDLFPSHRLEGPAAGRFAAVIAAR